MAAQSLSKADIDFIRRILSVAETGKSAWDPGAVYIYADDNRFKPPRKQITLSIGFTESGNLKKVLQSYVDLGGKQTSGLLPFMADLGRKDRPSLCGSTTFVELLKAAGKEDAMAQVQTECFDQLYLGPAFAWAEQYGFKLALSYLVIADSFLHSGSMLDFLMNKFPEKKPVDGGNEKVWIEDYLNARHSWLKNHSNKALNPTVYRANCYLIEASKGNWDLQTAVLMHGTEVARLT